MQTQLNLFTGQQLRDEGIKRATDSAERRHESWPEIAYQFLQGYIRRNRRFMTEQVREASEGYVPEPPSTRAWGGVVVRAARRGLIRKVGFANVSNPTAHCTPATVWEVI